MFWAPPPPAPRRRQEPAHYFQMYDPRTGEVTREWPRLVVFNSCEHWWRTMTELRESPKNPEDVDTDAEDHAVDCSRYGIMRRRSSPDNAPQPDVGDELTITSDGTHIFRV